MALSTTPELLRELAMLYRRVAELERAGGLLPGRRRARGRAAPHRRSRGGAPRGHRRVLR